MLVEESERLGKTSDGFEFYVDGLDYFEIGKQKSHHRDVFDVLHKK